MSINKKMDKVIELNQSGRKDAAWSLMKELMGEYPNEAELWSLQGYLYAGNGSYDKAISSLDKAIAISPQQATFYFHRGGYSLNLNNVSEAIKDFDNALDKDNYNDITFTQVLYFHRAEAFLKLGKKEEALADLSHIPEYYQTWTFKLRSKADLIADCNAL